MVASSLESVVLRSVCLVALVVAMAGSVSVGFGGSACSDAGLATFGLESSGLVSSGSVASSLLAFGLSCAGWWCQV